MMFSFAVIDGILATAFYLEALNLAKFSYFLVTFFFE